MNNPNEELLTPNAASNSPNSCPYCGQELSPWKQVLLKVDRLLICPNCGRQIMLDVTGIFGESDT